MSKKLNKSVVATASRKKNKPGRVAIRPYPYDGTFAVLMTMALLAKAGRDVNSILVEAVEEHLGELATVPEFIAAQQYFQRTAAELLTVDDESLVAPMSGAEKEN